MAQGDYFYAPTCECGARLSRLNKVIIHEQPESRFGTTIPVCKDGEVGQAKRLTTCPDNAQNCQLGVVNLTGHLPRDDGFRRLSLLSLKP